MPIILESNSGVPTIFFLNVRIQVNGFQACCVGTVANTKSTVLIWYSITSKITESSHHFNKSSLTLVFSFWKEKISACFHNCFVVCSTWQPNCSAPTTISLPNGDEFFFCLGHDDTTLSVLFSYQFCTKCTRHILIICTITPMGKNQ